MAQLAMFAKQRLPGFCSSCLKTSGDMLGHTIMTCYMLREQHNLYAIACTNKSNFCLFK